MTELPPKLRAVAWQLEAARCYRMMEKARDGGWRLRACELMERARLAARHARVIMGIEE